VNPRSRRERRAHARRRRTSGQLKRLWLECCDPQRLRSLRSQKTMSVVSLSLCLKRESELQFTRWREGSLRPSWPSTRLPLPILYGVWHTKEGSGGARILRNSRAIVLQECVVNTGGGGITMIDSLQAKRPGCSGSPLG